MIKNGLPENGWRPICIGELEEGWQGGARREAPVRPFLQDLNGTKVG